MTETGVTCGHHGPPSRIHVIGTSGTGKTTLAVRLATIINMPVHHLDEIARLDGQGHRASSGRPARAAAAIAAEPGWITEGVHLGWTAPLLEHADLIIWLDHVEPATATRRIIRRFVRDAVAEAKRRRGRDRYLRFRSYASELRGLGVHLRSIGRPAEVAGDKALETRQAIAAALVPHSDRLVICRSQDDVEAVTKQLALSRSAAQDA